MPPKPIQTAVKPIKKRPISTPPTSNPSSLPGSPSGGARMAMASSDGAPRPSPPGRTRTQRSSLGPATRSTTHHLRPRATTNGPPVHGPAQVYTGIISERTEEEVVKASREALQDALRKEWSDREKLIARIDEMDASERAHEGIEQAQAHAIEELKQKYDAALHEQAILESELESANDLVDHLRSQLQEADRHVRQGKRRYADQEKAFEAERQVHQADLTHLHQRIKSLAAERSRTNSDEPDEALQEELITLTASHQTLVQQLTTLTDELHEVKNENGRLQEENESWQLLIQERTLAGTMRGVGGLLSVQLGDLAPGGTVLTPSSIRRKEPNSLETLEEQMEMDDLHAELEAQQPIFDETDRAMLAQRGSLDLPGGRPSALSDYGHLPAFAEIEALKNEVRSLNESNKALQLYCSKILDRIISQEGFEHVLSVDYRTRRFGTRSSMTAKSRPTVQEMAQVMESNGPSSNTSSNSRPVSMTRGSSATPSTKSSEEPAKKDEKKSKRGFSLDLRSLGFGSQEPKQDSKSPLKPLELASRARAASGPHKSPSSISTPPASQVEQGPVTDNAVGAARKLDHEEEDEDDKRERHRMEATLKLMGLSRDGVPTAQSPSSAASTPTAEPRPAPSPAIQAPTPATPASTSWFARRFSREPTQFASPSSTTSLNEPATPAESIHRGSTPLARLSAALTDSTTGLNVNDASGATEDEAAAAALKAYDAREKEQVALLAQGKSVSTFTSPPQVPRANGNSIHGGLLGNAPSNSIVNDSLPRSRSSASIASSRHNSMKDLGGGVNGLPTSYIHGIGSMGLTSGVRRKGRESVSTLWSMGSSTSVDEPTKEVPLVLQRL